MVRMLAALLVCASAELSFAQEAARPTAIAPGALEFRDERRLPLQVCDAPQGALLVTWVDRDNTASRMTKIGQPQLRGVLEAGDLIVQIDGQPVKTVADYFSTMRRADAQAAITIRDVNSGAEEEWSIATHQVRVPIPPAAQSNVSNSKLHVVYAAQTNDKDLGEFVTLNVQEFQELIGTQIREERTGSFTTLSGPGCNAQQIIAAIDGLKVAPQDAVFVMYQGHGAFAPAIAGGDPAHGHFFQLADGDLPRQDVWHHLLAKRPRFALLMSDCCNVQAQLRKSRARVRETELLEQTGWSGFEELVFCYRGMLDLTSSSRGQRSWYSVVEGGWFSHHAIRVLFNFSSTSPREWDTALSEIASRTDATFLQKREKYFALSPTLQQQFHQLPTAYAIDLVRDDPIDPPTGTSKTVGLNERFVEDE